MMLGKCELTKILKRTHFESSVLAEAVDFVVASKRFFLEAPSMLAYLTCCVASQVGSDSTLPQGISLQNQQAHRLKPFVN
jgi:hypothetical protein